LQGGVFYAAKVAKEFSRYQYVLYGVVASLAWKDILCIMLVGDIWRLLHRNRLSAPFINKENRGEKWLQADCC